MKKELDKKIELRMLAIKGARLEIEIFDELDGDYIDYRIVRNKERAVENIIKKISKLTDAPADRVRSLMHYDPLRTWGKYFDSLRAIGVPIATQEEVKEFDNKK